MPRSWFAYALASLCLTACGTDLGYDLGSDGFRPDAGVGGVKQPPVAGDLPCDVKTFLANTCQGCHATEPRNGAPMSLMTYGDLLLKNSSGIPIAQRALARMRDANRQMPPLPAPAVASADVSMFEAWVNAGTPPGDCKAAPGPFDGPTVCTSGRMWRDGDDGSQLMHPGRACITCHTNSDDDDAPSLRIGGTVYPTGHEPNDCNGFPMATVEVTDANGNKILLQTNSAGNFLTTQAIPAPIRVAVLANGKRRSMNSSPPVGDCNSCHTVTGANGAPGRITIPY